jgi:EAL domain-containing protein (putative c-di-GMP-specific phosphodiesterase class I)
MEDLGAVSASLGRLREGGVAITVDDFGTGFTSLAHLKDLPLDRLKIDRSFITGLPADRGAAAVARAIVEMGRGLSLAVVAEGVETEAQRNWLIEQGCDAMQGFLIAAPMEEGPLLEWLRRQAAR